MASPKAWPVNGHHQSTMPNTEALIASTARTIAYGKHLTHTSVKEAAYYIFKCTLYNGFQPLLANAFSYTATPLN